MSKLMSLDQQLEKLARKWFMSKQNEQNRRYARKFFEDNKKEIIEEYLDRNPKIKQQYETKKKTLLKIKLLLGAGLMATTLGGVYVANQNKEVKENPIEIENEVELEKTQLDEQIEQIENDGRDYEAFFEEAREIDHINRREKFITEYTKEIIVEAYNKEHPDNPITADRLETLSLNEIVLKKTDRLGNYTYERIPQKEKVTPKENEELVRIGGMYDFRVDGKTVAVFVGKGNILPDKNVEKQDMSFNKMIDLLQVSLELKDVYKHYNSRTDEKKIEDKYEQIANEILEEKEVEQEKEERM